MRFMGIDYGRKRIGVALSDETGTFAQPAGVWPANDSAVETLVRLAQERRVTTIVIGESRDWRNQPNPVMKQIEKFKTALEQSSALPVVYEPELFTSAQAKRAAGEKDLDARAAALILQSYLDRHHAH